MKYPIVARRFTEILNERGMNQSELARRIGVGRSNITHYVTGTHCPNTVRAHAIGKVLNVNPAWLMGFDVDKYGEPEEIAKNDLLVDRISNDSEMLTIAKRYYELTHEERQTIINLMRMLK